MLSGMDDLEDYLVNLSDYQDQAQLGRGRYGRVWRGSSLLTGWTVAVKEIMEEELVSEQLEAYKREVRILAKCNDQFLLEFVGFTTRPPYAIVTSFMPCGSLFDALYTSARRINLNGTQKTNIAIGIVHGMKYLHAHKVLHRDLKSPNILLDDRLLPRIADFGLGRFIEDGQAEVQQLTGNIGTTSWMAPELMASEGYGPPIDVYAFGVILYEMLTELIPFKGMSEVQIIGAVLTKSARPEIPDQWRSTDIAELIERCWSTSPMERPTFHEIYGLFETHAIAFPGSDRKGVDILINEIKHNETVVRNGARQVATDVNEIFAIRKGAQRPVQDLQNELTQAARDGDVTFMTKTLAAYLDHVNVNAVDRTGVVALHAAIERGQTLSVKYLVSLSDVDVNIKNANGNTPLIEAVRLKQMRIIEALATCERVDPNVSNAQGMTALKLTQTFDIVTQTEISRLLSTMVSIRQPPVDLTLGGRFPGGVTAVALVSKL